MAYQQLRVARQRWIMGCALVFAFSVQAGSASSQFLPKDFYTPEPVIPHIERGSRFGVQIGMDRLAARNALNRHWNIHFKEATACPQVDLGPVYCQPGAEFKDSFDVTGDWLGGHIELYSLRDKVISIRWWRNPFDP